MGIRFPPIKGAPWMTRVRYGGLQAGAVRPAAPASNLTPHDPFLRRDPGVDPRIRGFTERLTVLVNSLFGQGYLEQTGISAFRINGYNPWVVGRAPTVWDDSTVGVEPGNVWIDTLGQNVWFNVDATPGLAVWRNPGAVGPPGPTGATGATGPAGSGGSGSTSGAQVVAHIWMGG